jgi:hypothetical protein
MERTNDRGVRESSGSHRSDALYQGTTFESGRNDQTGTGLRSQRENFFQTQSRRDG